MNEKVVNLLSQILPYILEILHTHRVWDRDGYLKLSKEGWLNSYNEGGVVKQL